MFRFLSYLQMWDCLVGATDQFLEARTACCWTTDLENRYWCRFMFSGRTESTEL
jgi:hypothetical protein